MVSQRRKGEHYGRSVQQEVRRVDSGRSGQREEGTTGGADYGRSGQQEERTAGGVDSEEDSEEDSGRSGQLEEWILKRVVFTI